MRKREGKVYLDYLQNGHGQLLVAPYSVRPRDGAPASAPLRWSDVNRKLSIDRFTIRTLPARMRRLKAGDPMLPVLEQKPDLVGILARLAALVE
jgi:bifunctional non-homologous end joining protein LigD